MIQVLSCIRRYIRTGKKTQFDRFNNLQWGVPRMKKTSAYYKQVNESLSFYYLTVIQRIGMRSERPPTSDAYQYI